MAESKRHTQLDGLRGYAAVAVIVFHSILDRDPTLNQRIVRATIQDTHGWYNLLTKIAFMAFSGETAVLLFFVLSGTVLFESLRQRHAAPAATALGFSIRRFLRLYPTFLVCLLCCFGSLALTGAFSWGASHFWANAALSDFSVLGASWTLQVEFLAIPFILIGFWSFRRFGVLGILAAYALFAAILAAPALKGHVIYFHRFLACFALGLLIPTRFGAACARRLPAWSFPIILAAVLTVRHLMGLHWWSMDAQQMLAALLIAQLYYQRAGRFGAFLDGRVSQYLGRLSYSVYLFNIVYLILIERWMPGNALFRAHPLEWGLLLAAPVIGAAILTAHFTEKNLEQPSIALGRRLTQFSLTSVA